MIVERSMSPDWLSNTYLVAAEPGGNAFLVDAGGSRICFVRDPDGYRIELIER